MKYRVLLLIEDKHVPVYTKRQIQTMLKTGLGIGVTLTIIDFDEQMISKEDS